MFWCDIQTFDMSCGLSLVVFRFARSCFLLILSMIQILCPRLACTVTTQLVNDVYACLYINMKAPHWIIVPSLVCYATARHMMILCCILSSYAFMCVVLPVHGAHDACRVRKKQKRETVMGPSTSSSSSGPPVITTGSACTGLAVCSFALRILKAANPLRMKVRHVFACDILLESGIRQP
jgi:hypothetical protein